MKTADIKFMMFPEHSPKQKCCEVRVMARCEGWAMVRRKGSMPFVVRESQLFDEAIQP